MQGRIGNRTLAGLLAALTLLLAACQTVSESGKSPSLGGGRQLAIAEKLAREQQYAASAQAYEDLARSSSAELRNRYLLRAANEWLRANNAPRGEALLREIGEAVPASDATLRGLSAARAALLNQRPDQALAELDRIPQPWPRESAPDILEVRALALFAYGRPAGAVIAALDRERLLSDPKDIMQNRQLIWDGVQRDFAAGINMQPPLGANRIVSGWLDIAPAALTATRNPFEAHPAIDAWRMKYPEHPANEFLNQQVIPQLRAAVTFPGQIALLLPFSGAQQIYGLVVRDGILAAVLQLPPEQRPVLRMYDTAAMGVQAAYTTAQADGAQFIVGPLTKPEVASLAAMGTLPVPTLALNELPDTIAGMPNLFRFWLDPTEEARQVARHIVSNGMTHGIALIRQGEKGQRVYSAFVDELLLLGGSIVGYKTYDPQKRDYRDPINSALLIDESNARARALGDVLGMKLEFEPRARKDIQFIFIDADPRQGRTLRPTLRAQLLDNVPVFATPDIYEPDATANSDLNGVAFPDMPWLVDPDEQTQQLRAALNRYWPSRTRDRGRLYALGYDSFRLIPLLMSQSTATPTRETNGVTGRLTIDQNGRVFRELEWARFTDGRPEPLLKRPLEDSGTPTASTLQPH